MIRTSNLNPDFADWTNQHFAYSISIYEAALRNQLQFAQCMYSLIPIFDLDLLFSDSIVIIRKNLKPYWPCKLMANSGFLSKKELESKLMYAMKYLTRFISNQLLIMLL